MSQPQGAGRGCPVCHMSGDLCLCGLSGSEQINKMVTHPISNYTIASNARPGLLALEDYLSGMDDVYSLVENRRGRRPVDVAKLVLGPQDFCWTGSVRHWVWVRPFGFDAPGDGPQAWRWRFYASTRGFALEVEDRYKRPYGVAVKAAAPEAFYNFMRVWRTGVRDARTKGEL